MKVTLDKLVDGHLTRIERSDLKLNGLWRWIDDELNGLDPGEAIQITIQREDHE